MKPVKKRVRYGALPRKPDSVRSNFSTYFQNKTFAWIHCWKIGKNSVFQNKLPHLSISVQQLRRRRKTMHVQNREGRAHKMGVTSKCNKSVAVLSLINKQKIEFYIFFIYSIQNITIERNVFYLWMRHWVALWSLDELKLMITDSWMRMWWIIHNIEPQHGYKQCKNSWHVKCVHPPKIYHQIRNQRPCYHRSKRPTD